MLTLSADAPLIPTLPAPRVIALAHDGIHNLVGPADGVEDLHGSFPPPKHREVARKQNDLGLAEVLRDPVDTRKS